MMRPRRLVALTGLLVTLGLGAAAQPVLEAPIGRSPIVLDDCDLDPAGCFLVPREVPFCVRYPGLCDVTPVPVTPAGCLPHSAPPPQAELPTSSSAMATYQRFPASGALETAWYVTYDHAPAQGLFLTSAWFKPGAARPWLRVLYRAGLSEIFVPYSSGSPRYLDLSTFSFDLVDANAADRGPCGRLMGSPAKVVREVIDKGPLWKDDGAVHRGQKLRLWATLDAANYNYVIAYDFHDDGTIAFLGAGTAENLPNRELESHVHNLIWRVDVDLDGAGGDEVWLTRHVEPLGSQSWTDVAEPFAGGREGALAWKPREFNTLQVRSRGLTNAAGAPTSYDVRPLYRGVARHAEEWMRHDLYATRYRGSEVLAEQLMTYVGNRESTMGGDVVIWQNTPLLHVPRSEDGVFGANGLWQGVALAMWGGFEMRPRNLFDGTPFHP